MLISIQNILQGKLSALSSQGQSQSLEIELPLSKSESNRALMIMHYAELQNFKTSKPKSHSNSATQQLSNLVSLSNSDDTVLLQKHLNALSQYVKNPSSASLTLDCRNAGTVFRFLMTAVANLHLGVLESRCLGVLLTGSERMKQRPISSLVEALRSLGVSIEYTEKEGYPPVLFTVNAVNSQQSTDNSQQTLSTTLHPTLSTLNSLEISAEQSSQFASSLLLVAPLWKNALELHLTGNLSSLPYIDMTISMMRQCGIDVSRDDRDITVKPGVYNVENIIVEPDWSAAAFWYEMVSLSDGAEVLLKNLNINSLQADAAAIKMFECLGVETFAAEEGTIVKKVNSQQPTANSQQPTANGQQPTANSQQPTANGQQPTANSQQPIAFNFKDCPDLFPAVIAACAGNRVSATFTGLKNLSIKESDRKQAMMNELMKINITFENVSDDELMMSCPKELPCSTEENPINFNNYEDHRIAMALSVLSMKIGAISMENVEVVSKSYPGFF